MASRNASKEKQRPMPPLPPTPPPERYTRFEVHSSSVTRSLPCLDDDELYDEPDQLMHDMGLSNSASTLTVSQDYTYQSRHEHTPHVQGVHMLCVTLLLLLVWCGPSMCKM